MDQIAWITRSKSYTTIYSVLLAVFFAIAFLAIRYSNTQWLPAVVGAVFGVLLTLITAVLDYRRVNGQLVNRHTLLPIARRSLQFWSNLATFLLSGAVLRLTLFTHYPMPVQWLERLVAVCMAYLFSSSGINAYLYAPLRVRQ